MGSAMKYIDDALHAGQRELEALRGGDMERVEEMTARRERLLSLAWDARADADATLLAAKFQNMQELQETLTRETQRLMADIRAKLNQSRKENQRLAAYRKTVEQGM